MSALSLSALALLALLAAPARAIDPDAGTAGASFVKIGVGSARAMALGRSYVALAEGTDSLNWNPAGLALTQQREMSYGYLRHFQDIDSPFYMAYAHPLGRTVLGVNFGYLSVDGFEVRDSRGVPLQNEDVRVQDGFGTVGIGRSFWYEKLFLGGAVRVAHEDNAGSIHNAMAGDFGALLKPNQYITFGFSSQNFGAGSRIAEVTRGGAAIKSFDLLTTSIELSKAADGPVRLGLGGEFMLPEDMLQIGQVYLRMGYYSADDLGQVLQEDRSFLYPLIGSPKLSFGLGMFTAQAFGYGMNFDYTLVSYGSLGTADMIQLKVKF